jgi:hypothetical protein
MGSGHSPLISARFKTTMVKTVSPLQTDAGSGVAGELLNSGQIDNGSNQMLSEVIENDRQHDLRVIR